MNVQEVLENYNTYKARISITESEIQELENEIIDIKSANLDGMPKAKGYVESSIEKQVIERQDKIADKRRYIKGLELKIKVVENLVKILKKYNQDVIEMRYYQKMSIEEIAAVLHIPKGTVKSRLHAARTIIKKKMEDYGYEKEFW